MSNLDDKRYCPLLKREIFWGGCYEVQEVREDSMDMEMFFAEPFDMEEAARVCEECRWFCVNEQSEASET